MAQQTVDVHPALGRIRQRGYWRMVVRPMDFQQDRIADIRQLYPLVDHSRARFSGWEFPYLGPANGLVVDNDFIEQAANVAGFKEYWRFYQSGQFIHYRSLAEDWEVRTSRWHAQPGAVPGQLMPICDTLYRLTEMFEFASQLAVARAYNAVGPMHLDLFFAQLKDRRLYNDSKGTIFHPDRLAQASAFQRGITIPLDELISDPRLLALRAAEQFFALFSWDATPGLLERIQEEFVAL